MSHIRTVNYLAKLKPSSHRSWTFTTIDYATLKPKVCTFAVKFKHSYSTDIVVCVLFLFVCVLVYVYAYACVCVCVLCIHSILLCVCVCGLVAEKFKAKYLEFARMNQEADAATASESANGPVINPDSPETPIDGPSIGTNIYISVSLFLSLSLSLAVVHAHTTHTHTHTHTHIMTHTIHT